MDEPPDGALPGAVAADRVGEPIEPAERSGEKEVPRVEAAVPASALPLSAADLRPEAVAARFFGGTAGAGLPEIVDGPTTRVGSRASYFAAYGRRVAALAGPRWRSALREALGDPTLRRRFTAGPPRRTVLHVTVSGEGRIEAVSVRESCGIPRIDRTLAEAFRQVRFLPNPPDPLLEADGSLRFLYILNLYGDP